MDLIPVSRPSLGEEELASIKLVFDSGWLGLGTQVFEFEQALQKFLGAKHVVCTEHRNTALHLALDTLGIGKGDEVIVPSFTFVATVQAITATGAKPVFCDIHADDLNMDVKDVRKKITKKTRVILPVHYRGIPCDMDEIHALAQRKTCMWLKTQPMHSDPPTKRKIGSFGDITCFSFDPIKNISCGEGGAVVFQDDALLEKHPAETGFSGSTRTRGAGTAMNRSWFYDVVTPGLPVPYEQHQCRHRPEPAEKIDADEYTKDRSCTEIR